jgi:uncharacterized membrane protein YbhN (UPF0104 family)
VTDSAGPRYRSLVKQLAALLIVAAVAFFFWNAIRSNWAEVRAHDFKFNYWFVAIAFLGVLASSLLSTLAWQTTINSLSEKPMTFSHSVATVNTTSLTKYLPGKFWSYALQMYWLVKHGYTKSLVLYVNLLNLVISLLTGVLVGLGLLLFSNRFPLWVTLSAFALALVADVICLRFHAASFRLAGAWAKRLFKRDIGQFDVSARTMFRLHLIHFCCQLISAAGAYVLCFGIGYRLEFGKVMLVMSALILSDVASFVAFVVPGGLGVREGVMYLLLGGVAAGSLALVLPIASRMVYLVGDALLGAIALYLLRRSIPVAETVVDPQS